MTKHIFLIDINTKDKNYKAGDLIDEAKLGDDLIPYRNNGSISQQFLQETFTTNPKPKEVISNGN